MCHVENSVLQDIKPNIYCRYIDDIFVEINDENQLISLQEKMKESSILRFTSELNVDKKLPFLDVLIESTNQTYETTVYTEATNTQEV
jgi:hypothetical protein